MEIHTAGWKSQLKIKKKHLSQNILKVKKNYREIGNL